MGKIWWVIRVERIVIDGKGVICNKCYCVMRSNIVVYKKVGNKR